MRYLQRRGVLLLSLPYLLVAGEPGRGVRSSSLAGSGVSLPADAWSVYQNPAQLGFLSSSSLAASFVPDQYGLTELRAVALAGSVPLRFGGVGGSIERFGFNLYHESLIQAGMGWVPVEAVSIGITAAGKLISIQGYGSQWIPLVTIGIALKPADIISFGAVVRNAFGAAVGRTHERLPQSISWGATWIPDDTFLVTAGLEKDIRYPATMGFGLERSFFETISFRAGVSSPPRFLSAGASVRISGTEFGYAGRYHSDLGWTHQIEAALEITR